MKKILPVFSYLFHPLFIPVITVLLFFLLDVNFLLPAERYLVLMKVVIITMLIPIAFYFLLRSIGRIDSVMAHDIGQRKAPLLAQALLFYLLIRQSVTFDSIPELYFFFFAAMLSTIMALFFVLLKVKASLHMMGMGGLIFFILGLGIHNGVNVINVLSFLLFMTGLTGSSRLVMGAHDMKELMLGFFIGMIPQVFIWYFWL